MKTWVSKTWPFAVFSGKGHTKNRAFFRLFKNKMGTKTCKKCGTEKEKTNFYRHKAVCKECISLKNKEQCKYCLKFFSNLKNHEKTVHSELNDFKYVKNIIFYECKECKNNFNLEEYDHYSKKCKKCYNKHRNEKVRCENCNKIYSRRYLKKHKCTNKKWKQ